jgi:hypothetical protein
MLVEMEGGHSVLSPEGQRQLLVFLQLLHQSIAKSEQSTENRFDGEH